MPSLRRKCSRTVFIAGSAIGALVVALVILIYSIWHVPAFYRAALLIEPEILRQGNDEMLESATALMNTARHEGEWYALLSEEQVNGWLAIDLAQNHPELLPPNVVDLRARFEPDRAIIACGYQYPGLSTIVSVKFDVYLAEPHVIALRVHGARAGAIPVPITPIMDGIANAAERLNLRVEWRQAHGDPVAFITLPEAHTATTVLKLDALQLRDAAIYLAGRTESISPSTPGIKPHSGVASRPDENRNVQ
ncbi:MAG TPA: hypothetical protein VGN12_27650 [Pirellulales bacterium]